MVWQTLGSRTAKEQKQDVAECLAPALGSAGEEDSVDDERSAEIDRPPRMVV